MRTSFRRFALLVASLIASLVATTSIAAERVALVIANGAYATGRLDNVASDARRVRGALEAVGFDVIPVNDADKSDMLDAVEAFMSRLSRDPASIGFVYYAGHALQVEGVNYLISLKADIRSEHDLASEAFDVRRLLWRLGDATNKANVVVLDACRNNPFRSFVRSPRVGLGVITSPRNTLIAFSTGPNQLAPDNGVYAQTLADELRRPGVYLDRVFRNVANRVDRRSDGTQQPWLQMSAFPDVELLPGEPLPQVARPRPTTPTTGLADFAVFTDTLADGSLCGFCPEMMVIPAGTFKMGSPAGEEDRDQNEGPQREVRVGRFAIGWTKVTVGQFRAFIENSGYDAGGCHLGANTSWRNPGFVQTDEYPVVCVSWEDANAYVGWLSGQTGQHYRLPSEAEWEFAARAGTMTPYAFSDGPTGDEIRALQAFRSNYSTTTEVGTYHENDWKLDDMHVNDREWVEDCWHDNYEGAPTDGSARLEANGGDCVLRVLRGALKDLRPTLRNSNYFGIRVNSIGFRVARTLTP